MSFKSYESKISPFFRASLILKEYSVGLKKEKRKGEKKEIKKCFQSFASFRGSRGGSCLMFILQHADSSGNGSSFASWSFLADYKQGLFKQLTSFPPSFPQRRRCFLRIFNFFICTYKVALKRF